jgi:serine protease AprX
VGGATSYTVTVTPSGGVTGLVALTVSGLPTDGSGVFTPTPLYVASSTCGSSSLPSRRATTAPGSYTLTITGVSGGLTHATTVVLHVKRK